MRALIEHWSRFYTWNVTILWEIDEVLIRSYISAFPRNIMLQIYFRKNTSILVKKHNKGILYISMYSENILIAS